MIGRPRHAIVEVRFGPSRGQKLAIAPGRSAKVGRTERADLAVPRDAALAGVHFELSWDGERCTMTSLKDTAYASLRDEHADAGVTLLNGERVERGEVANGSFLRAGNTIFMVYLEASTPPPRERTGEGAPHAARETALGELKVWPAPLYAVLDAAHTPRILQLLRESVEPHASLFDGVKGEAMGETAPYLVPLPPASRLLESLVLEGFGKRWGIFVASRATPVELRRHLRRFLLVEDDETRERLYFRFFDPRVMDDFLATATARQRALLFAELERLWVETPTGELAAHGARA
jgi:hypothetical protein